MPKTTSVLSLIEKTITTDYMYAFEHLEHLHRTLANFEFEMPVGMQNGRLVAQEKERNLYVSIVKAKQALDFAYANAQPFSIPLSGAGYALTSGNKPIELIVDVLQEQLCSESFIGNKISDDRSLCYLFFTNEKALIEAKICLLRLGISESEMCAFTVDGK